MARFEAADTTQMNVLPEALRGHARPKLREPEVGGEAGKGEEGQGPTGPPWAHRSCRHILSLSVEGEWQQPPCARATKPGTGSSVDGDLCAALFAGDMQWFKVPYWIKADEETRCGFGPVVRPEHASDTTEDREMVQKIKQHFMDEMNAKATGLVLSCR